jgi:membrane associated rhomboid family serine protease
MGGEQMIFIPLSDDNPLRHIPYQWVTVGLIGANVVVFAWQYVGIGPTPAASFALVPSELFQAGLLGGSAYGRYDTIAIPEGYTLLTYMFFHADILHLSTNMLFLWVFGDNVEDAMGHLKFLVFYIACGVAGGLAHAWMGATSWLPLVGASGAVAGVITAYLLLHPGVRVWVLVLRVIPMRITAVWILGVWAASQVAMLLFSRGDQVAWSAHVGGMLAGALLTVVLRRPGVQLFDGGIALLELPGAAGGWRPVPSGPSELP